MIKFIEISLIFVLGANLSPSIQAANLDEGRYGRLEQDKWSDQGAVGAIFKGLFHTINDAACGLLGPNFFRLILENHSCPEKSLASDTFKSLENLCRCINSNPCLSSAVISVGVKEHGLVNLVEHVGKCCKNEDLTRKLGGTIGGQIGSDLLSAQFPRTNDFFNKAIYESTDAGSDLLCSLLGPGFLQIVFTKNCCANGVLIYNSFESIESFCYYFNYVWSSQIKKCVTDSVFNILFDVPGISKYELSLAKCCPDCPVNPPPRCKPTSPVIIPKC